MIIDVNINHPGGFRVTDRKTGEPIRGIVYLDTEAATITRIEYGPDGTPVIIEEPEPHYSKITETRGFECHLDPDQLRYVEMTQGRVQPRPEALTAR